MSRATFVAFWIIAAALCIAAPKAAPQPSTLTLTTPDVTSPLYDTQPIAALTVNPPANPSTRNFASGIWVVTNGAAQDKGRGVAVQNVGHSDAFYAQLDNSDGCGYCALVNAGPAYAVSIGLRHPDAVGEIIQQMPGGGAANLASYQGNEPGAAELLRVGSTQATKVGVIFRMPAPGNLAVVVKNASEQNAFTVAADTGIVTAGGYRASDGAVGITRSGSNCVITAITDGLITGAVCN